MDEAGEMLAWPFRDPRWPSRIGLMALLWLGLTATLVGIPLASLALTGWMLAATDNLRAGRFELPPAGLHLRRGWSLFAVQLAYLAVLLALAALPFWAGIRAGGVAGGLLVVFGQSVLTLGSTLLVAATPALAVLSERGGARLALRPGRLLDLLASHPRPAIAGGLMSLLCLDIISPVGLLACGIGLALTATYAYAVLASTILAYERQLRR